MSKTFNLAILSRNLDTSGSDININDNAKFLVGTGNDLEIVHNGSDSVINDAGLGSLLLQSGGSTKLEVNATGVNITGPLAVSSTVDGRDISTDGLKLDGIEANATADQTDAEIKTAYENNADTNAFTDAEKTKLASSLEDADFTNSTAVKAINQGLTTTSNVNFNDLTLAGNLVVNGTTTTVNSNTVNIGDNILTLNSDETGTPSQNAGIEVERGTDTNKTFLWNETNDAWTADGDFTATGVITGPTTDTLLIKNSAGTTLKTIRGV